MSETTTTTTTNRITVSGSPIIMGILGGLAIVGAWHTGKAVTAATKKLLEKRKEKKVAAEQKAKKAASRKKAASAKANAKKEAAKERVKAAK